MLLENNIKNSQNLPFKAAQYASYRSAFRGLSEQGVLGLYKGNLTNVFYLWIGTIMKVRSGIFLDDQKLRFLSRELSLYLLYTSIDIALHPLQSLQTRLILQNRNKKMALYRNVSEFFKAGFKRKGLFFQGALIHLPKNFFIIAIMNLNQVKAISNVSNQNSLFILSSILANVVSYPFITLMRRIMCQDLEPFMLERRYIGMKDGFKKMIKEEGVLKGPWRGFGGFFVVSSFMLALNFTYHQTGMF